MHQARRAGLPEPPGHGLDGGGIELPAGFLLQDFQGRRFVLRAMVHPVRGDRIEDVRHGQDAGPQRDGFAPQAVGIALAVPSLVVVADDRNGPVQGPGTGR